jgi:predicted transcriptional regulator
MSKVWVQVWTAKVPGSVQVEESELRKVEGLESVSKLIPMLVKASEYSGWETVPNWGKQLVSVEESVEVLEPQDLEKVRELESLSRLEKAKEKARELSQPPLSPDSN